MPDILRSAWTHTWGFFWPSNKKTFWSFVVSLAIGIPLHVRLEGFEAVMGEGLILLIYGVAPLGGFVILLFVWNLWLAPYRLMGERVDAIQQGSDVRVEPRVLARTSIF